MTPNTFYVLPAKPSLIAIESRRNCRGFSYSNPFAKM
jgi:hypothetical protein